MTSTVSIKSPADIPAVVAALLGFTPTESLVIVAIGGGPTARVDITTDTVTDAVTAMASAESHWTNGVLVAVYSDEVSPLDVEHAMASIMPSVKVIDTITVTPSGDVVTTAGDVMIAAPSTNANIAAKQVAPSRESFVAEAAAITDEAEAWLMARESYLAGNGARSWCFLDRFVVLHKGETAESMHLTVLLEQAVDPKSVMGQTIADK